MNAFTGYFETCVWTHHDLHWGPSWCPPIHGHPLVDHMGHCPHRLYQNSPNWLGYKVSATDRQITNNRKNSYRKKKETRSNEMTRNGIKEHCLICTLCKFWVQYRVDGSVFNGRSWRHMFVYFFYIPHTFNNNTRDWTNQSEVRKTILGGACGIRNELGNGSIKDLLNCSIMPPHWGCYGQVQVLWMPSSWQKCFMRPLILV